MSGMQSWGDEVLSTPRTGGGVGGGNALPPPTEEIEMQEGESGEDLVTTIKVHTTYRYNDKGEVEKVVRRVRTVTRRTVRPVAVLERAKGIPKFGEALNGNKDTTKASSDDVTIELPGANAEKDVLQILKESSTGGSIAQCRFCGQGHWSMMCPYKDVIKQGGSVPSGLGGGEGGGGGHASIGGGGGGMGGGGGREGGGGGGTYKPPSLRAGAEGATGGPRVLTDAEKVQLKVSNLSPDTTEDDLRALFQPFGNLDPRFRIARDPVTGASRGFVFLKYAWHKEAENARVNLNGWRLHHMVLKVEYMEQRDGPRGGGGGGGGGGGSHRYLSGYGKALADTKGASLL